MKEIYLAGGCFWGMQAYFNNINGVISTCVGYANGNIENPTYELVCHDNTGFAETIYIQYSPDNISLSFLLEMYFQVIDPTTINRQGGDIGSQYRTGIYYVDKTDQPSIQQSLDKLQQQYKDSIVVENKPLHNFYPAEKYHQDYLKKNPMDIVISPIIKSMLQNLQRIHSKNKVHHHLLKQMTMNLLFLIS